MEAEEGKISFGQGARWQGIEADEATFDKALEDSIAHWVQRHWFSLASHLPQPLSGHQGQELSTRSIGNPLRPNGFETSKSSFTRIVLVPIRPKCLVFYTTVRSTKRSVSRRVENGFGKTQPSSSCARTSCQMEKPFKERQGPKSLTEPGASINIACAQPMH